MGELKHAKVKSYTPLNDGTVKVETRSYDEKPSGYKEEIMQHTVTNRNTFLSDLVASVAEITSQKTQELTLTITADEHFFPKKITKIYTVKKETFPRR